MRVWLHESAIQVGMMRKMGKEGMEEERDRKEITGMGGTTVMDITNSISRS